MAKSKQDAIPSEESIPISESGTSKEEEISKKPLSKSELWDGFKPILADAESRSHNSQTKNAFVAVLLVIDKMEKCKSIKELREIKIKI